MNEIIIATDAGREGELVARLILEKAGSKKPIKRLWISSVTDKAIREGFAKLKNGHEYDALYDAAMCRAEADWLVGITRALTCKYNAQLSCGRVQTPTLAMIAKREEKIRSFIPEGYYGMTAKGQNIMLTWQDQKSKSYRSFDKEKMTGLMKKLDGQKAVVEEIKKTPKKTYAPLLYDLTELQREANQRFGYSAKETLNIMQRLYENHKVLTYPRTDSRYLSKDIVPTIKDRLEACGTGPYRKLAMTAKKKDLSGKLAFVNDAKVSDHHAIIPTVELAEFELSKLRDHEQKILFLIAVHTVEAMEEDHIFMETEVEVRCQDEIFKAKGKVVKQIGWKLFEECFKNEDGFAIENPADVGKDSIPQVEVNQKFYNVSAAKTEHFTAPPKPYSEDTLLAAMETAGNKEFEEDTEKKGLGTPATRAGIIEKLIASRYAVRKGKQILPTEDGKVLIEILPDFLKSASMTAEWENQLLEMEQGRMVPDQFMAGIEKLLSMMLNHCDSLPEEETRRFQKKESMGTCPVCGSLVYEGKKNFYCGNRECNFCLWKENKYLQSMEKDMDARMAAELLKNGSVRVKDLYSRKKDMYFEADLHMDADEKGRVTFSLSFPEKKPTKKHKRK